MKVKKLLDILNNVKSILEVYENQTVEQMLNDIYSKTAGGVSPGSRPDNVDDFDPEVIVSRLPNMKKEEIVQVLKHFTKNQLQKIAGHIDIKMNSSEKKDRMIAIIANYYGYIELNRKMANRPPAETGLNLIENFNKSE